MHRTIVLVHGAWHGAWCWDPVVARLDAEGRRSIAVDLPSVSSTGATDDGISVGYGAQNVTIQDAFLAGNTRSIFMKYGATTRVSVHHTWIMKQWARGPLVSSGIVADLRNLIVEDWTTWGTRFEKTASGNLLHSLFAFANGALFLYGIASFIGFGAAWDDLHHGIDGVARRLRPAAPPPERASVYE